MGDEAMKTKSARDGKSKKSVATHSVNGSPGGAGSGALGLELSETHPNNSAVRQGWLHIDQSLARYLLTFNTKNRTIKQQALTKLVRTQKAGLYNDQNTDAITFNLLGELVNGQHRLKMVVETGIPIYALVVVGVSDTVMETTDNGTPRSIRDILQIENLSSNAGHKNIGYIGPNVNAFLNYLSRGNLRRVGRNEQSNAEILRYYRANQDKVQSLIAFGRSVSERCPSFKNVVTMKRVAVLKFALESTGAAPEDIEVFFEMLMGRITPNYSMNNLRIRLERLQVDHDRKKKVSDDLALAILVKGWNAFVLGEEVEQFRWRSGGAKPEAFPEPVSGQ